MLDRRPYAAADNEQAGKSSPVRRSGLVMKSEKEAYRRGWYLLYSLSKEEYGRITESGTIAMTRVKTTMFSCDTAHFGSNTLAVVEGMMDVPPKNELEE